MKICDHISKNIDPYFAHTKKYHIVALFGKKYHIVALFALWKMIHRSSNIDSLNHDYLIVVVESRVAMVIPICVSPTDSLTFCFLVLCIINTNKSTYVINEYFLVLKDI